MVLEPHRLHFVAVQISIRILFAKLSHCFLSKLDIVNFKDVFGAQGIQVSVGLIEVSGELSQDHGLFLVACELHDLGLVCIQLNNCRGVRDSFIDVRECLFNVANSELMLGVEIVKPQLHGRILLLLIVRVQTHFLFHALAHALNDLSDDFNLGRVSVHER